MNNERILRATHALLLFTGYHVHWYELKNRGLRVCLWGGINTFFLGFWYLLGVIQHFSASALLKLMQDVSPFLRHLIRLQMLLGIKIFIFHFYEMRRPVRAANGLARLLPRVFAHKPTWNEVIAYVLLYSTYLYGFCVVLYIAIEMHFELPPLDTILVSLALFIPHLMLAGSVRLYCINLWFQRDELQEVLTNWRVLLVEQTSAVAIAQGPVTDVEINVLASAVNPCVKVRENDVEKGLLQVLTRLSQMAEQCARLKRALRPQLLLLFGLSNHCLLAGVYCWVYFESEWHVLFTDSRKRIFYAANSAIFVLIGWDYVCLCASTMLFNRKKEDFCKNVEVALKQRKRFEKEERHVMKNMRELLAKEINFNIVGSVELTVGYVFCLIIMIGVIIALMVMYQYFNDQLVEINTRLDGADNDDDND